MEEQYLNIDILTHFTFPLYYAKATSYYFNMFVFDSLKWLPFSVGAILMACETPAML